MKPLASTDPGKIGPYRTIAVLGSGAMGRVLLAREAHAQLVAVKRVHVAFVEDEGFRARFRREVKASRKVSGKYTAKVLADNTGARVPWMATEYVAGVTLQEAVDACGPFTDEAVYRLTAALAAALTDIHRVDLVHRDLKPSNIMLTHDGLKVIDFGIARAVDASTLTGTGTVMGSYAFMSPEQVLADAAVPASDVFALGAVLGFAATGHGPFDATTVPAITHRIINEPPRLEGVSADLTEFIEELLARVAEERPLPGQILDSIPDDLRRPIDGTDTTAPWNPAIHALIDARHADLDEHLRCTQVGDTVIDPSATSIPDDVGNAETKVNQPPPKSGGKSKPKRVKRSGEVKAAKYVRELAAKLGVDLATVRPTGPDGSIASQDVRAAASEAASVKAKAKAKADAARDRQAARERLAEAAREKLKRDSARKSTSGTSAKSGPGPQRPKSSTRPSSPPAKPPSSATGTKKKDEDWGNIIAGIVLVVLIGGGIFALIDDSEGDSGSDATTTSAYGGTTQATTGYDDAADGGDGGYDPPTTQTVDRTAGCSEAFDTISTYIDVANPALNSGDNATAIDAFRDMASGLRDAARLAENSLVETNIDILAGDTDKMADALVYQNNSSYDYWREVWTGDRDDLSDSCYG